MPVQTITWANALYEYANDCVVKAHQLETDGKVVSSWAQTVPARLSYLADVIVNVAILPFGILRFLGCGLLALSTWNWSNPSYQESKRALLERSNHLVMSSVGFLVSPTLAHKYRDANVAPYLIAVRIVVITGIALYYGFFKP